MFYILNYSKYVCTNKRSYDKKCDNFICSLKANQATFWNVNYSRNIDINKIICTEEGKFMLSLGLTDFVFVYFLVAIYDY